MQREMAGAEVVRGRRTEDGGQRSEVRGQRSEVRGQRSEDGGRRTELGISDFGFRIVDWETGDGGDELLTANC